MSKNIVKRKNGTYSCVVYFKDPLTSKTKPKWKGGFKSEKEAEKELTRWNYEINEGKYSLESEMKLSVYLTMWLDGKEKTLKPMTYQGYLTNIQKHINPYIGQMKIKDISATILDHLYDRLSKIVVASSGSEAKYLSRASIRYVHATLRAALNDAVKKRLLPYNACEAVTLPSKVKYEAKTLSVDEMKVLISGCHDSRFGLEILMMMLLGLRRGEALGLRFSDIDFSTGTAHIRQQYTMCGKDSNGKQIWGIRSLKTKESDRSVGIPTLLLVKIIEQKQLVEEKRGLNPTWPIDLDLVCCGEDGSPRNINSLEHGFKMLLAKLGLPLIRLHDLRHTYATQLSENGIDIVTISRVLGHTSIKTTADIYIAKNKESGYRAAKAMDGLFQSAN